MPRPLGLPRKLLVGQIYIHDNPLLKPPLTLADVKHMLQEHWGTTLGLKFVYGFNRIAGRLSGPTVSGWNGRL